MSFAVLCGFLLAAALAIVAPACKSGEEQFARASRIERLDQAIGGPVANARPGDFLLENDQIRAVVEQGGRSRLPLDVGGSLIDLDLVRHEAQFRGGRGLDQMGQIAPVANLFLARALSDDSGRITSTDAVAEVTVSAEAAPVQRILEALGLLIRRDFAGPVDHARFRLYTEYRLEPGQRLLKVRTTVGFDVPFCRAKPEDGCNAACDDILFDADCSCPKVPARCAAAVKHLEAASLPDRPRPMGIADILLGDLPRPVGTGRCQTNDDCDVAAGESCTDITTTLGGTARVCRGKASRDPGVFFGDMLLFGGNLSPFIPGTGFDTESDIRRLFDSGEDTLSNPLEVDAVYAIGDRVSYGYAVPNGKILVPVFGGPFSMGVTAAASCRHDEPGCLAKTLLRTERWISVGTGDAASAAEPLNRARGIALGEVVGTARWAHSGQPVDGAEVYVLSDPRSLACDEACQQRCGSLEGVDDAAIRAMPLEELTRHTRCRTRGPTYLEGVDGIVTQVKADPGTDAVRDGVFAARLPAGDYVLVAQEGSRARSTLAPIRVEADAKVGATLVLQEPGRLLWSLADELGRPTPGRVMVGRCLSGASCSADDQCGDGKRCNGGTCSCDRVQAWPLSFGGGRFADGVHAFDQTASGVGELHLPPGEYDVLFSHGPHYSVDRTRVQIAPNQSTQVHGTVVREVNRAGWTSADFHVHAENSLDSGTGMKARITSFLAEEMDFLSSSDHDVLSWYAPLIEKMGVRNRLGSQVGAEVTTQELGHFIGYPMKYQAFTEGDSPEPVTSNGAPEWRESTPEEIFAAMRAVMVDETHVVSVPHPYSYFDSYGIDPVTLEPADSIVAIFNPLVRPENFSGRFDAMELMNSKSFDLLRRPTIDEVRFYSQGLDALLSQRKEGLLDEREYARRVYNHSAETTRRMLHRTPAEQQAALAGEGGALACRCASDGDCAAGRICDPSTLTCVDARGNAPAAPGDAMCRSLRGVFDDWFNMLNRGVRRTGVGGSDVHGIFGYEAGSPRTLIRTGATTAPHVTEREIVKGIREGRVVVTNGPMVHFEANGGAIGDVVRVTGDGKVSLKLRVETARWYDVDRVEVYRNGELIHWFNGCASRRPSDAPDGHDHPCIEPGERTLRVDAVMEDAPPQDAWYVVVATGLDGRSMSPVYGSASLPRLGTFEVTQKIYDIVPVLAGLRIPRFPSLYPTFPVAITNPIWVDVGEEGWTPSRTPPSWCTPGHDFGCDQER